MSHALKNALKGSKAWVSQSPPSGVNPPFEIRPSLNKGLGVFAKRSIPRASIFMRDRVVLHCEKVEEVRQTYRRFERLPRPIQDEILKLAVVRNVPRAAAVGPNLLREGVKKDVILRMLHLVEILDTNGFETVMDDPNPPYSLCLTASRFNHSCVPNADHFNGDDSEWMSFVANRDITEGEEITISYIEHLKQRTERRRTLKHWAIDCQCPACDFNHPDTHAHEYRLKRIALLDQDPSKDFRGRLKADKSRARNVLEDASVWSRKRIKLLSSHSSFQEHLHRAYQEAFVIAIKQYELNRMPSKLKEALEFLELVIELDSMYYGSNSIVTSKHRSVYLRISLLLKGDETYRVHVRVMLFVAVAALRNWAARCGRCLGRAQP